MSTYTEALLRQRLEPELDRLFCRCCERRFAEFRQRHGRPLNVFVLCRIKRDIARDLQPVFNEVVDRLVEETARKIEAGD